MSPLTGFERCGLCHGAGVTRVYGVEVTCWCGNSWVTSNVVADAGDASGAGGHDGVVGEQRERNRGTVRRG
jgi:hypothetical protein